MLSMLMQVFYCVCVVAIIWVLYGYSMAFTEGRRVQRLTSAAFSKAFLAGVTPESVVETFNRRRGDPRVRLHLPSR
jgi:Amt family ammonium transporter